MLVVSHEVFEMLCHPERKPTRKLKPKDLVARDSFTGETMNLEIPNEPLPNEIAAHECGHVVALAAAGLADEFTKVTAPASARTFCVKWSCVQAIPRRTTDSCWSGSNNGMPVCQSCSDRIPNLQTPHPKAGKMCYTAP